MHNPIANIQPIVRTPRILTFCILVLACAWNTSSQLPANTIVVSPNFAKVNTGTDVTTGIQNALNTAASGDTVLFSSGTYLISGALLPKSGTTLQGAGETQTIIADIGTTSHNMIRMMSLTGVTIEQMTLNGQNSTYVSDGIHVNTGSGFNINNVTVENIPDAFGIDFVTSVTDSFVQNNTITNIGDVGIWLQTGSSYNTITGNNISGAAEGGVRVHTGSTNVVIDNNTISGTGNGLGIEVWTGCTGADIENNTVDKWLSVCASDKVAVRGNLVQRSAGETFMSIGLEEVDSQDSVYTDNIVNGQSLSMSTDNSSTESNEYHFLANNMFNGADAPSMLPWAAQLQGNSSFYTGQSYFYNDTFTNSGTGFRINTYVDCINLEACQIIDNYENNSYMGIQNINSGSSGSNDNYLSFVNCTIENNGYAFHTDDMVPNLLWSGNTVSGNTTNTVPPTWEDPAGFWEGGPTAAFTVTDTTPGGVSNTACTAMPGDTITFNPATSTAPSGFGHLLWDLDAGPALSSADNTTSQSYTYQSTLPAGTQGLPNQPGNYRVSLIVWDSSGRASRTQQLVAYDDFYEAESLSAVCSPNTINTSNFIDSPAYILSNNMGNKLNSTAVGQSVSYTVPNVPAGTYEILVRVKEINSRGIFQLSIGPSSGTLVNLGSPQDTYTSGTQYVTLDLGSYTCSSTGNQTLKFTVTGKNASSSGYSLAFDYFEFAPNP